MNQEFPQPKYRRMRRIHDLERIADDQRETLRRHTAELAADLRGGEWWREAVKNAWNKATANSGGIGGLVRALILRHINSPPRRGKKKFPWLSAILAGVAAAGFGSWWKHRHEGENTSSNGCPTRIRT